MGPPMPALQNERPTSHPWPWVLSRYLAVAQRPRQTVIRMPVVRVGVDDIVRVAGDISNVQYTRTRAAIRTAFSIGRIEKVAVRAAKSAHFSPAPSPLGNLQNFHLPNRNSELYFCPLIAVPKRYTAMGVCVHVRLWGNSTATLEDTKRSAAAAGSL